MNATLLNGLLLGHMPGPKCVIIAVHGTWAPDSPWTRPNSVLRRELETNLGNETVFKSFAWSGRNSHSARLLAAEELCEFVKASIRDQPGFRHLIVAHSHGGNVALYALRDEYVRSGVDGFVCIATPFLNCKKRNAKPFLRVMSFIFPLCLWIWIASPLLGLDSVMTELRVGDPPSAVTAATAFLLLPLAFCFFRRFLVGEFARYVEQVQESLVRERALPLFDDVPVLVVRHAWDEALVPLGFLGKLAEASHLFFHAISSFFVGRWIGRTVAKAFGGFLLAATVAAVGLRIVASGALYTFFSYLSVAIVVGLLLIISALMWSWFVPRLAAARLAYGESDGLHWMYVHSIAESLPPCKHEVSEARAEGLVFAHSWLHSNEAVAKAIAIWAGSKLARAKAETSQQPAMATPPIAADEERGRDWSGVRSQRHRARVAALSALGVSYLAGGLLAFLLASLAIQILHRGGIEIRSFTEGLSTLCLLVALTVFAIGIAALRRSLRDGSGTARYWMVVLVAGMCLFFVFLAAALVWGIIVSVPTLHGASFPLAVFALISWLITLYMICLVPAFLVRSYCVHRAALSSRREPVLNDVIGKPLRGARD